MPRHDFDRWTADGSIAIGVLLAAAVVAVIVLFEGQDRTLAVLAWVEHQRLWAPLIFTTLYSLAVILVLPTLLLTLGAGFLFGVLEGSMLVVLAETAGAVIAFLIGRQLFGTRCARWLETCPYLAFLNQVSRRRGWKVVLLTRMVPFFPFKLSNYLFGLTGYPLREFAVGSLLGVIPLTVANVYLGSLAAGLATLGARPEQRAMWEWAVYGGGLLISLGIAAHLIRTARRTLGQLTAGHGKAAGERLRPHRE